jgi:hypothetical protein
MGEKHEPWVIKNNVNLDKKIRSFARNLHKSYWLVAHVVVDTHLRTVSISMASGFCDPNLKLDTYIAGR